MTTNALNTIAASAWRAVLSDPGRVVPEATWDLIAYCRFLAARMPEAGELGAADAAQLAEELIADLKEGIDRRTQGTFEPPLVSARGDLLYNYFRHELVPLAQAVAGDAYAQAFGAELRPVSIAPPPKPEAPASKSEAAPQKAGTPPPQSETAPT